MAGGEEVEIIQESSIDSIIEPGTQISLTLNTEKVLELRRTDRFLQENLSLAGHLIHGVPGRGIRVTYCTNKLTREEIEHAGFRYMTVDEALAAYPCRQWENGWHTLPSGEEVYFVANAALGMWRCEEQPRQSSERDCSK